MITRSISSSPAILSNSGSMAWCACANALIWKKSRRTCRLQRPITSAKSKSSLLELHATLGTLCTCGPHPLVEQVYAGGAAKPAQHGQRVLQAIDALDASTIPVGPPRLLLDLFLKQSDSIWRPLLLPNTIRVFTPASKCPSHPLERLLLLMLLVEPRCVSLGAAPCGEDVGEKVAQSQASAYGFDGISCSSRILQLQSVLLKALLMHAASAQSSDHEAISRHISYIYIHIHRSRDTNISRYTCVAIVCLFVCRSPA